MTAPLTFSALGTTWWIEIFDEVDNERRDELFESVTALINSIEDRFSRFKADSLVSTLNHKRTLLSTDTDLLTLIKLGQELYTDTNGVFNFLLGEHLEARGYDAKYSFTARSAPQIFPNPLIDIVIDNNTISLLQGKVDLGGYGKGWAIDQVAKLLTQAVVKEFLINAGGDMYGTSEGGEPIVIYLEHPLAQDTHLGSTTLFHQGFAASSQHKRQWKHAGTTYTHIVETKVNSQISSEMPVDGIFVKAATATMADAFATTGLLVPAAALFKFANKHQLGLAFFNHTTNSMTSNQEFTNKL
jgi:thiamine biosynthesis lipoprotein